MWTMRSIGFLYLLAGIWCALQPALASGSLGYQLESDTGLAEFFTVYGGLEVGLGAAMIVTTLRLEWFQGGLVFAVIISWVLAIFRVLSLLVFDPEQSAFVYLSLEVVLAVLLGGTLLKVNRLPN